jgi:hypothetical protein
MTVFITKRPGVVQILTRDTSKARAADVVGEVRPGWSLLGRTFEEWDTLPEGRNEVEPRRAPPPQGSPPGPIR